MAIAVTGRKKRLVLDIGASAVRLCEMSKTKTGYQLVRYVQREFDSDPALSEEQRRELRVKATAEVLKQSKSRLAKTVFGVPGQSVFTRTRTLPPVPEFKVNQIVKYEIQQQIPFGLDQIAMDYQILDRSAQGGYEVLMAAIKVEVVEKHLDVLKAVKRSPALVDVCPLAAYNWVKQAGGLAVENECVALINIGAATTDIVIERGGQFRFTRPLNVGGNDITRALAEEFSLDFPAAEKLKRERAFAPTGDPSRDGKGGEVIGRVLQRLCGEIMRSFAYFRSLPGGGQVNRIVVTGGGARLKNIVPFLRNQLGMDVRVPELLKGLTVGPGAEEIKKAPEQACAVLGMALRCVERAPLEINLIPPRIVAAARQKEQAVYWAFSILALVLSFLSVIPAAANENKLVKARIELLKQTIRAYDPELVQRIRVGSPPPSSSLVDQLNRRKGQLQTLENQVNGLDRARRQRRFWLEELSLLNDARPATGGIWFSSVETMVAEEQKPQGGGAPAAPGGRPLAGGGPSAQAGGFPGIESKLAPTPAGGGSGPGGLAGGRGAGGGGAPGQEGPPASVETVRPNGMVVQGYAESAEIITQYLDELKRTARQLPNGWYLSAEKVLFREATVQRVGWDVLYNAPADVTAGAGGGNRPGGGVQSAEGLYTFRVRVVFQRTKDRPEPPKPGDAPAEASAK